MLSKTKQGTVMVAYDQKLTIMSYMPPKKTKKNVMLMSTMHSNPKFEINNKPDRANDYNATMGAFDIFNQMCAHYSCFFMFILWNQK